MEGVYGEVVAVRRATSVEMKAKGDSVRVVVGVPDDGSRYTCPKFRVETDFETARRMVEGEVSVLVVVSDGGDDE